ncbi:unnamed protein product [Brassica rapa subsp. trilocularis]
MPNASDFNNFAARLQPMLLFQSIHIFKIKLLLSSLLVIWTILRLRTVARQFLFTYHLGKRPISRSYKCKVQNFLSCCGTLSHR